MVNELYEKRREQMFPKLAPAQLARREAHGTRAGEVLVEPGDARHKLLMTGAVPNTQWLNGCVALDEKGFVRTGPDLHAADLAASHWPLPRSPYLLETSVPGIFAAGDVRSGNVKRIASAVGEGSICVQFVHRACCK